MYSLKLQHAQAAAKAACIQLLDAASDNAEKSDFCIVITLHASQGDVEGSYEIGAMRGIQFHALAGGSL